MTEITNYLNTSINMSSNKITSSAIPTSSNDLTNKTYVDNMIPVGTIMAFPSSTPPLGWLSCDGSLQSKKTYSMLYNVIGTSFGAGDTNNFNLPDLRNQFIRGYKDSNRQVGNQQTDMFKSHTHNIYDPGHNHNVTIFNPIGAVSFKWSGSGLGPANVTLTTGSEALYYYNIVTELELTGDTETRPKNICLLYCIKAVGPVNTSEYVIYGDYIYGKPADYACFVDTSFFTAVNGIKPSSQYVFMVKDGIYLKMTTSDNSQARYTTMGVNDTAYSVFNPSNWGTYNDATTHYNVVRPGDYELYGRYIGASGSSKITAQHVAYVPDIGQRVFMAIDNGFLKMVSQDNMISKYTTATGSDTAYSLFLSTNWSTYNSSSNTGDGYLYRKIKPN